MHNNSVSLKISLKQKIVLILFGLLLFLILLEIGLRLGGLMLLSVQEHRNKVSLRQKGTYRIMCIGESTTVIGGPYSYPVILEEILNQRNIGIRYSVINCGVPSVNTSYIVAHLNKNLDKYKPHMVIAMIGINDGEDYIFYEDKNISLGRRFLNSLKSYKLVKIIKLHIVSKVKEERFMTNKNKGESPDIVNTEDPLAVNYADEGKYIQTEGIFKREIESDPLSSEAYFAYARFYERQDNFPQAIGLYKKSIELNPRDSMAYVELAWCYQQMQEYLQAEKIFLEAVKVCPQNPEAYIGLGYLDELQGKYPEAEVAFKKAVGLNPKYDHRYYRFLLGLYNILSDYKQADVYSRLLNKSNYYNPVTYNNYWKIREILKQKRIKLICVQYPLRSIEPLTKMFNRDERIIFVDNEKIFKDAIKKENYWEYFIDMFAGDFGHCTRRGNKLLAGHIAGAILKNIFN